VGFALYEDSRRYDAFSAPGDCPTLIFQGLQDDAVDPKVTERFAQARSNRTLYMLNDGHQLLDSLEFIWSETARALGV
jgi:pimeloyl-ACP methyl ester carboxylesterase